MSYYKDEREYELLDCIALPNISRVLSLQDTSKQYVFAMITKDRTFYFQAQTQEEMNDWLNVFRKHIRVRSPVGIHTSTAPVTIPHSDINHKPLIEREYSSSPVEVSPLVFVNQSPNSHQVTNFHSTSSSRKPTVHFLDEPDLKSLQLNTPNFSPVNEMHNNAFMSSSDDSLPDLHCIEDNRVLHSGYLLKLSGRVNKTMRLKWFVLRSHKLAIYKNEKVCVFIIHTVLTIGICDFKTV